MGAALLAGIQGAGNLLGSAMSGYGNWKGAKSAQQSAEQAITANQGSLAKQNEAMNPYQQTGLDSFRMASQLANSGGNYVTQPNYEFQKFGGVNLAEDPSYKFRMQQGVDALDASAAAKGSLHSGAQQKELLALGQNMGSQEYGNAYNRQYGQFQNEQNAERGQHNIEADAATQMNRYRMNDLMGLGQQGQQAAGTIGQNIGQANQTDMMLRGQLADAKAKRAGGVFGAMGNAMAGGANAAGNGYLGYMMGGK